MRLLSNEEKEMRNKCLHQNSEGIIQAKKTGFADLYKCVLCGSTFSIDHVDTSDLLTVSTVVDNMVQQIKCNMRLDSSLEEIMKVVNVADAVEELIEKYERITTTDSEDSIVFYYVHDLTNITPANFNRDVLGVLRKTATDNDFTWTSNSVLIYMLEHLSKDEKTLDSRHIIDQENNQYSVRQFLNIVDFKF